MDDEVEIRHTLDGRAWCVVVEAPTMAAAEIPAALLRSAGIPVFFFRESVGLVIPLTFGAFGVKFAVPEEDYGKALALLRDDADDDDPGDDDPDHGPPPRVGKLYGSS
jgi:hypothetical protein